MKINYNTAVQAGKQARIDALNECVQEIRTNTKLSIAIDNANQAGVLSETMLSVLRMVDYNDKKRIVDKYRNLIYPNSVFGIADQVIHQLSHNEDWPV